MNNVTEQGYAMHMIEMSLFFFILLHYWKKRLNTWKINLGNNMSW